jgi:uncharacterized protein (DUF1015 family)
MSSVRPFPARVVRQGAAARTVTAMAESQDDSGVALLGVAVDHTAYAPSPAALYVYRQSRGDVSYTGIVCDVAVSAIADGQVRGHEAIHQVRVDALMWHHSRTDAPPALVMLLHREGPSYAAAVEAAQREEPLLDFEGPRGFRQTVWRIEEGAAATTLVDELAATELYIADGHHRTAAALEEWRDAGKPPEAGLLCVVHPMEGLSLSAFHRRVSGPVDAGELLEVLGEELEYVRVDEPPTPSVGTIGLYVDHRWYVVRLPAERPAGVAGLDAALLQAKVLDRLDPSPGGRARVVDDVPAASALDELVARCDVDEGALFLLAPPPAEALIEVADAGEVMPPKTTYFEPKPAAGIFLLA